MDWQHHYNVLGMYFFGIPGLKYDRTIDFHESVNWFVDYCKQLNVSDVD